MKSTNLLLALEDDYLRQDITSLLSRSESSYSEQDPRDWKQLIQRVQSDRPEILLYDEPTTGLDPIATKNVDEMIRRTADDFGVTSVVISHDMASTFRIGDRISMLYEGKIIVTGTPQELLANPHPVLREFVETSGAVSFNRPPEARP